MNDKATKTRMFSVKEQEELTMRQTLQSVYDSLKERVTT